MRTDVEMNIDLKRNVENFIGCDASFEEASIVIFGAPFDSTTSYRPGARFGSSAMRHESFGLETYSPYQDKDLLDYKLFDSGDLELCFGSQESALEDIEERIHVKEGKVEEITKYSSTLVEEYIQKLETRVKELMKDTVVDEARLMQEIVIFSDKSSIEEELTRLASHISQFLTLIKESSPIGKKIDFLIQEINREVNTIGSKANCLDITNRVIEIKTEVENIREQIQNIE